MHLKHLLLLLLLLLRDDSPMKLAMDGANCSRHQSVTSGFSRCLFPESCSPTRCLQPEAMYNAIGRAQGRSHRIFCDPQESS
jgi:hypothetical protein